MGLAQGAGPHRRYFGIYREHCPVLPLLLEPCTGMDTGMEQPRASSGSHLAGAGVILALLGGKKLCHRATGIPSATHPTSRDSQCHSLHFPGHGSPHKPPQPLPCRIQTDFLLPKFSNSSSERKEVQKYSPINLQAFPWDLGYKPGPC